MGSVEPLPEAVRNSIRSGIILFDLTRVVEELVFNSLDAGATKVSVYVNVGTCYVKVVDDGSGISRDGLVLLGERYVTSKLRRMADMDAANRSFGFRGEALASISDVSLLEIETKACGRPNGYRKVMKGSKCLYLGISDDRKDVGTTVVVHDLFYNQPVRRKYMQSSPKKVLHSVKKCVFRIALAHSNVSFKVVDTESEDELFCSHPSSALSLLMSGFGIEDSNFLYELNVSDGSLKLSGYVSGPRGSFSIKDFQYVYINSRFVCKGPIHKLLNQLAARFECPDPWKANSVSQKGRRSNPQSYPAYIVNLSCPSSLYDLNFEPSKTCVEFKDWVPILKFIENAIQQLWRESTQGESSSHAADMFKKDEIWKRGHDITSVEEIKKSGVQTHCSSRHVASSPLEIKEGDQSYQSGNGFLSKQLPTVTHKSDIHHLARDNLLLPGDYFLEHRFSGERSSDHVEDYILSSEWQSKSPKIESGTRNEYARRAFTLDNHEFISELEVCKTNKKPFLQSCSSQRSLQLNGDLFVSEDIFEFPTDCFRTKRRRVCPDEDVDILKYDVSNQRFDIFPITWRDEASTSEQFPAHIMGVDMSTNFDDLSGDPVKSFSSHEKIFAEEKGLASDLVAHVECSGLGHGLLDSEWYSVTSGPLSKAISWDAKHVPDDDVCKWTVKTGKRADCLHFADSEEYRFCYDIISKSSNQDNGIPSCTSSVLGFKDYAGFSKLNCKFLQGYNPQSEFCLKHSDKSTGETGRSLLDSCSKGLKGTDKYESRGNQLRNQDFEQDHIPKEQSRRSHSAPPFYIQKKRFVSLNHHSMVQERPEVKNLPDDMLEIENGQNCENSPYPQAHDSAVQDFIPREIQESIDSGTKWRKGCQQIVNNNISCHIDSHHSILDISSGFLHLAGNSLVPDSIHKNCLEYAKVLQQVDKKFIPVVAGGTLAVIDQHAADERIRLEELRQKVLSGEAKTVTYLAAEQELVLPEMEYQLLHNYAEQIRNWGWICDIQAQGSRTFKKNLKILHRQQTVVTLLAVPCILGVNLSDGDLLEFLQQLADTDGSSTMPPSVLRVLNFKACRGAIMFGDSLLPSECALIVQELKHTSLCFQCAHGRPTTVPLVQLEALHEQIAKLVALNEGSSQLWHGLCRRELSLERAAQRLSAARG